jgi:hypothetical protein
MCGEQEGIVGDVICGEQEGILGDVMRGDTIPCEDTFDCEGGDFENLGRIREGDAVRIGFNGE